MTLADAALIGMQWIQDEIELYRLRLSDEKMFKAIIADCDRVIAKAEQWIQEAQDGCVEQCDVAADPRRDRADDGVLPDSQPDGAVSGAAYLPE